MPIGIVQAAVLERATTLVFSTQEAILIFCNESGTIMLQESLRRQAQWLNKYQYTKWLTYVSINSRMQKLHETTGTGCFAATG
jgi:hydroxymethylbilane synthase